VAFDSLNCWISAYSAGSCLATATRAWYAPPRSTFPRQLGRSWPVAALLERLEVVLFVVYRPSTPVPKPVSLLNNKEPRHVTLIVKLVSILSSFFFRPPPGLGTGS